MIVPIFQTEELKARQAKQLAQSHPTRRRLDPPHPTCWGRSSPGTREGPRPTGAALSCQYNCPRHLSTLHVQTESSHRFWANTIIYLYWFISLASEVLLKWQPLYKITLWSKWEAAQTRKDKAKEVDRYQTWKWKNRRIPLLCSSGWRSHVNDQNMTLKSSTHPLSGFQEIKMHNERERIIFLRTPVTQTLPFTFSVVPYEQLLAVVREDEVTRRKHAHTHAHAHTHTHAHTDCPGSRSLGNHAVHTQTAQSV